MASAIESVSDSLAHIVPVISNDSTPEALTLSPSLPMQPSPSPSLSWSLALPWEVIENVVEHSSGRSTTLCSFALTCRNLYPRSTIVLFRHIKIRQREEIFYLQDMLKAKPHLKPCILSISIPFEHFSPTLLLRMAPNLSELKLGSLNSLWEENPKGVLLHPSVRHSCHQLGQRIQTLSLQNITFRSLTDFSAILLSFRAIKSLSCNSGIKGDKSDQDGGVSEGLITRLSEKLHLSTLTRSNEVFTLLVEAQKRTLTSLTCTLPCNEIDDYGVQEPMDKLSKLITWASPLGWDHLTSFTWTTRLMENPGYSDWPRTIQIIIQILNNFRPPTLQEVTVVFQYLDLARLATIILPTLTELCAELGQTLITHFLEPAILFSQHRSDSDSRPLNRRYFSWIEPLGKFFPKLADCGALKIDANLSGNPGHDGDIRTPLVISADGRWAATGSQDHTIIIWDLENQCIYKEWFIEEHRVEDFAFSPESRYIMTASRTSGEALIWDFHHDDSEEKSLGRGLHGSHREDIMRCAWSPDGSWIAVGPQDDGATHLYETTTFQRLHAHTTWRGELLAVSSDGRWVVTAAIYEPGDGRRGDMCKCWIWNTGSGKLHRELVGHTDCVRVAAFDSGGTRVVTGACSASTVSSIRIWDVESGEQLLALRWPAEAYPFIVAKSVFFSGDGRMVLLVQDCDTKNGDTTVWDASSGALLASLSRLHSNADHNFHEGHAACFSPCGSYLASGSRDGEVQLRRTSDWTCIAKVSSGGVEVTHVTFSRDGRMLYYGTRHGAVFFLRMDDLVPSVED